MALQLLSNKPDQSGTKAKGVLASFKTRRQQIADELTDLRLIAGSGKVDRKQIARFDVQLKLWANPLNLIQWAQAEIARCETELLDLQNFLIQKYCF